MSTEPDLERDVRSALEQEQAQLESQLHDLDVTEVDNVAFDENFADSAQVAAEQGEAKDLANRLSEQLSDVKRALDKLDSGSYGQCEVCGNSIGEARIEAMPATRYCIDHAG